MAVVFLTESPESNNTQGQGIYETKVRLTSPTTSDDYILPNQVGKINGWLIHVIPESPDGRGYLEITVSVREDVLAGIANWFIWDYGEIRSAQRTTLMQVSGVRLVNVEGTVTLEQKVV